MEPAPYGGFMTRTLDSENEQKALLARQEVEVNVNGTTQTLRPNSVHMRGVDNLSTQQIESFVDLYLNHKADDPEYRRNDDSIWFRVQWIDDSNANVIFKTNAHVQLALQNLSEDWPQVENSVGESGEEGVVFTPEYLSNIVEERPAKSYAASIPFHKHQQELKELAEGSDLFKAKKDELAEKRDDTSMDEDGSAVVIYIRQAFQCDQKVKNAAAYSRYYLLHGEPDRTRPRGRRPVNGERERGGYKRQDDEEEEDLFAAKVKTVKETKKREEVEEDLFASRLRERSPGRS